MRKVLSHLIIGGFCLLVLLMVSGCGPKSQFIVMPDPDGKVGKVEVVTQKGSQVLDQPWQSTEVTSIDRMPSEPKVLDEKKVREMFKDALEARPETPVTYLIYFKSGGTAITADSQQMIREVLKAIKTRNPHEISVSGHTDSVGSVEFNRILSLNRARGCFHSCLPGSQEGNHRKHLSREGEPVDSDARWSGGAKESPC